LLDRLAELRADPARARGISRDLEAELRSLLRERNRFVVAKVAQLASELRLEGLRAPLRTALADLLREPDGDSAAKRDPQCLAKVALARALVELEDDDAEVFLAGSRHVQHEPVWGGSVDTAAELRGVCAHGLLATGHHSTSFELVRLLADPETPARVLAVRAVSAGIVGAEELLRLVVLKGDPEGDVLYEAFAGLLELAPERSLAFSASFLDHADAARRDAATLALGASRLGAALDPLCDAHRAHRGEPSTLLLAISTLRSEGAFDYLLGVLARAASFEARLALEALAIHRGEEDLVARVWRVLEERADATLCELAKRKLEAG
jgi:hypothetical protein